ncbi:tRNA preQ [Sesbania bispinosa]|nr:tRNA preQ [Sesbania bispinosa]
MMLYCAVVALRCCLPCPPAAVLLSSFMQVLADLLFGDKVLSSFCVQISSDSALLFLFPTSHFLAIDSLSTNPQHLPPCTFSMQYCDVQSEMGIDFVILRSLSTGHLAYLCP